MNFKTTFSELATPFVTKFSVIESVPGGGSGTSFVTDDTLTLANGVLSVNTAKSVEKDNTLPVTSAAVFTEVGNINALLETI